MAFEDDGADDLAIQLWQFYAEVRNKRGEKYGKSALINLKAALQRHLTSPPHNHIIDIAKDREFTLANNLLKAQIKVIRLEGRDRTTHKKAIGTGDMDRIFSRLAVSNPSGLQMRVFMDIMIHFGCRGREGLRELRRDSFEIRVDSDGRRYAKLWYNEVGKTRNGIDQNVDEHQKKCFRRKSPVTCAPLKHWNYICRNSIRLVLFFSSGATLAGEAVVAGMTICL